MPIYEYRCSECQLKFELLRPSSKADNEVFCSSCKRPAHKVFSVFAAISRGSAGEESVPMGGTGGCSTCSGGSCATCH